MGSCDQSEVDVVTILFMYDDILVNLSEYEELDTNCELVKTGIEKGFIKYKATDKRCVKITGDFDIKIPKGQQGDLYIYDEEKNGSIWQAIYIGCFHYHSSMDKYFHEFSAIAA